EPPFEPVSPKELSVWDAEHPVPADAADAAGLRRTMSAASDAQLADLAKDRAAYRRTVGPALEAVLATSYPGPGSVRVAGHGGPDRQDGFTVERGTVERAADGTRVPYVALFPDAWDGRVVVWATPDGTQAALDHARRPTRVAGLALAAGSAVVVPDLYWTGAAPFAAATGPTATTGPTAADDRATTRPAGPSPAPANPTYAPKVNPPYAAFTLGYNRSVVGNRVHDLLSVVAMTRGWGRTTSVRLLGTGRAGPWAVLARAAAGTAVDTLAADVGGFDFDQVTTADDEMLLPGAIKYGGLYGFAALCDRGQTRLTGVRRTGRFSDLAAATPGVTLVEAAEPEAEAVAWLLK
ncbi:MAG: hypothetical protein JWO31_3536, partial [Phycisphaerales bacterium]|nr:hypothetical protein [Phycisphaerales bacterium]